MALYTCACGHHWSDITSQFDGYICWTHNGAEDALVRDLWSFAKACQSERREAWLADYFSNIYPQDTDDESVASDIFGLVLHEFRVAVFKCPACGRLMVNDADDQWRGYAPDPQAPSRQCNGV